MIAKLTGRLDETGADWAVIDVQGVGYLVHCSSKTLAALGIAGDEVTVFTDLQVSENDMRLLIHKRHFDRITERSTSARDFVHVGIAFLSNRTRGIDHPPALAGRRPRHRIGGGGGRIRDLLKRFSHTHSFAV